MAQVSHGESLLPKQGSTTQDDIVSLRLFQLNWVVIAIVLGGLCLSLLLTDFRIELTSYLIMLGMAALYGIVGIATRGPRPETRGSTPHS
jgi:uncharacterized membrane protein